MPMLPLMRLVHKILANDEVIGCNDWQIQSSALMVLQTATEAFLMSHFEDAGLYAIYAKRVTVMLKDMHLALRIRRDKVMGHNIESTAQLSGVKSSERDNKK